MAMIHHMNQKLPIWVWPLTTTCPKTLRKLHPGHRQILYPPPSRLVNLDPQIVQGKMFKTLGQNPNPDRIRLITPILQTKEALAVTETSQLELPNQVRASSYRKLP